MKMAVKARKVNALGLATAELTFHAATLDACWRQWEKFSDATDYAWEWMPPSTQLSYVYRARTVTNEGTLLAAVLASKKW